MSNNFQLSLFNEVRDTVSEAPKYLFEMPKIDLHRHLLGSITIDTFFEISQKYSLELPAQDERALIGLLSIEKPVGSLEKLFKPWRYLSRLIVSPEVVVDLTFAALKDASSENIRYIELRASWGMTGKERFSVDEFLGGMSHAIKLAQRKFNIIGRVVFGITRHLMSRHKRCKRERLLKAILEAAKDFKDYCVVGFDLSGIENDYPPSLFKDFFADISDSGFGISIHSGETTGPSYIWEAVTDLSADRIAHGLSAAQDTNLIRYMTEHNITLEICPTSNILSGVVLSIEKHPLRQFFEKNMRITINTDNPAIFRTDLSNEYYLLIQKLDFTFSDIQTFARNAVDASFASPELKASIREKLRI